MLGIVITPFLQLPLILSLIMYRNIFKTVWFIHRCLNFKLKVKFLNSSAFIRYRKLFAFISLQIFHFITERWDWFHENADITQTVFRRVCIMRGNGDWEGRFTNDPRFHIGMSTQQTHVIKNNSIRQLSPNTWTVVIVPALGWWFTYHKYAQNTAALAWLCWHRLSVTRPFYPEQIWVKIPFILHFN